MHQTPYLSSARRRLAAGLSKKWRCVLLLCLSCTATQATQATQANQANQAQANQINSTVEQLGVKVLAELPHDAAAFTQGLLLHKGYFYESTGLYGQSSLRKIDAGSGELVRLRKLDDRYFGEGLALVDQQLIQLTWQAGQALVYDLKSFSLQQVFHYQGQGWGLCFDGERLWMSDGSHQLQKRDAKNFSLQSKISITLNGEPLSQLNELACVGEHIYANIWHDHRIVRINKSTGQVDAEIDASALIAASGRSPDPEAVLNGITYDEQTDVFYVTGKLWPKIFKVQWQKK
ncbi:glutaminyl-peptide cyclotransferase [Oceanisphaera sp. W20_SRM_FM3]|uniref:glutaminyl-peptide cyclotransferase n=1 Tax=Oceanisphaera sp. W20_SRM_FM3 TaxID=3240267 RepID=UPI003F9CC2B5